MVGPSVMKPTRGNAPLGSDRHRSALAERPSSGGRGAVRAEVDPALQWMCVPRRMTGELTGSAYREYVPIVDHAVTAATNVGGSWRCLTTTFLILVSSGFTLAACGESPLPAGSPDLVTSTAADGGADAMSQPPDAGHSCAPSGGCPDSPRCGGKCCQSQGDWCDESGAMPVCRCGVDIDRSGGGCFCNPAIPQTGFCGTEVGCS